MNEILLEVADMACEREGRMLFSGLSFQLRAGDLVQVAGPNGCGKTSLLRTVCGLVPLQQGVIRWRGVDIRRRRHDFASEVMYLGHATGIKAALSPRENLQWYFALRHPVADRELERALAAVGLFGYEDTPCFQLSAGQQRRSALARLLLGEARVWILDEAFTAIDRTGVAELELRLRDFAAAGGAVLFTTHHALGPEWPVRVIELGGEGRP